VERRAPGWAGSTSEGPRDRRGVSRRRFLIGWGASTGALLAAACAPPAPAGPAPAAPPAGSAPAPTVAPPTVATPAATPAAAPAAPASIPATAAPAPPTLAAPAAPAPPAGATLRILSWQAATTLNPYFARGMADGAAARCCLEPLLTVDHEGRLSPALAAAVPSRENGGLPDDRTVVYRLREGVTWADGRPFTADDVVFTYRFIADPETASATTAPYLSIQDVEAPDPLTVRIRFKEPTGGWYVPFVGGTGMILPRHAFEGHTGAAARSAPFNQQAFGTGPYVVEQFLPGDLVVLRRNPAYREAGKPQIARIELKGGGDATTAARAVLQTGEFDYAWNLQVEAPVLQDVVRGSRGEIVSAPGAGVELIFLNQADPNATVDGEVSHPSTRHPFLADPVVRRALALAVDRPAMARQLYGDGLTGVATANVLTTPAGLADPIPVPPPDVEAANRLLDEAGYRRGADGVRATPAGARMHLVVATTVNGLRQKEQALIKDGWQKLGVDVELRAVDPGAYFSSSPNNPDAVGRFAVDAHLFTIPFTSPFPAALMKRFYGRDPGRDWAQRANDWAAANIVKWRDDEYDRLYEAVLTETDPERARELWRRLDAMVVESRVVVPLVDRTFTSAKGPRLEGPAPRAFDTETWNVADWRLA
jgi:peptide/nickel transport system substrate-binding protein